MSSQDNQPQALVVCSDLFFSTPLHAAAKRAGLKARTALSMAQALQLLRADSFAWAIVDLELPHLELAEICQAAKERGGRIVAFGPHVHDALLSAARKTGCDVVLTRGQAASTLDQVLSQKD